MQLPRHSCVGKLEDCMAAEHTFPIAASTAGMQAHGHPWMVQRVHRKHCG